MTHSYVRHDAFMVMALIQISNVAGSIDSRTKEHSFSLSLSLYIHISYMYIYVCVFKIGHGIYIYAYLKWVMARDKTFVQRLYIYMYICMYIYIYVCIYVYMYMFI